MKRVVRAVAIGALAVVCAGGVVAGCGYLSALMVDTLGFMVGSVVYLGGWVFVCVSIAAYAAQGQR